MPPRSYRILLVAPDSGQAESLSALVLDEADTFQVVEASCLESALPVLCAESVDALLLDDDALEEGMASLGKIHARFESLPIVVVVPRKKEALERRLLDVGASEVLYKETLGGALLKKALEYAVERRQTERLLLESEERFRELFENAKDIIFTLDPDGNFKSLNKSAEEVMGWSREEAQRINLKQIVPAEHLNQCKQLMSRLLNEEQLQQFEITLLRKDGKRAVLETSARLLLSEGKKKGIQGIARDVTERRNLENIVRQSQKLEAVGRLSGGLSHDFNNLLCVVSGHAELLMGQLGPEHPGARHVEQIKKAVDNTASLVRQLLVFSRKQAFHPRIVNLNEAVTETKKLLGRLIGEHVELSTSLSPTLAPVYVDPVQIEQVIMNLILNARDAMPLGGKLALETSNAELDENVCTRHAIIPAGKYVVLAVADSGAGMDEETQNRLFEPFYTTKESGHGTGLGLSTVYGIVKQSGGSIAVESEPGKGTTFRIYLPWANASAGRESSHKPDPGHRASETILLVENSGPLRALAREFLSSGGYAVLDAENGMDALRIAKQFVGLIHLLLTDVVMPGMGGKQLAGQFATLYPAAKVLYMSGYSDESTVDSSLLNEQSQFLEKPFTRDILLKKVRQALDAQPRSLDGGGIYQDPPAHSGSLSPNANPGNRQ
ncbi:MAG TPA: PAS domain S-box protein [Candidatus Methylomirabilis sp.]|nr:PAS domain S-box protein [Candidatus Methylomirabilis sp.]